MSYYKSKLLVYFLVECSNAMAGKSIENVQSWIKFFRDEYIGDPDALSVMRFSVITFDKSVRQIIPPTEIVNFKVPKFKTGGNEVALGQALHILKDCIEIDVGHGNWKPIVKIFCNGITDKDLFESELRDLRDFTAEEHITIYTADTEPIWINSLVRITSKVYTLDEAPIRYNDPDKKLGLPWETHPIDDSWPIYYQGQRRPIYFLIDCSVAMAGEPIKTVAQGIYNFLDELKIQIFGSSFEKFYISAIIFDSGIKQLIPLTKFSFFKLPQLQTTGNSTNLGAAFRYLKNCILSDKKKNDWRPVVFLFTTGTQENKKIFESEVDKIQRSIIIMVFAAESYDKIDTSFLSNCLFKELVNREEGNLIEDYGVENVFMFGNKKIDAGINVKNYSRRLPIYLLIDCSAEMAGKPIKTVKQKIDALLYALKSDPQTLDTAYLSVITFNSTAQQVVPLTDLISSFNLPKLYASGTTALGGALRVLKNCIKNEIRTNDWKPLVLIFTDSYPTDLKVFQREVQDLKFLQAANRL